MRKKAKGRKERNVFLLKKKAEIFIIFYILPIGGANLRVELNLELTDEIFDSELAKPGSEMFSNRTFWIEKEVCMKFKCGM